MIAPGTRVAWSSGSDVGVVEDSDDAGFTVRFGDQSSDRSIYYINDVLTPHNNGVYLRVLDIPESAPSPQPAADLDARTGDVYYNLGALMQTLRNVEYNTRQALGFYDSETTGRQADYLEAIASAIQNAIATIKPVPTYDGTGDLMSSLFELRSTDAQPDTTKEN